MLQYGKKNYKVKQIKKVKKIKKCLKIKLIHYRFHLD